MQDCVQHQRGKRKRLQFESAENHGINSTNSLNHTSEASTVDLPIASPEVEIGNVSNVDSLPTSSHKKLLQSVPANASCRFLVKVTTSGRCKESHVAAPRPAGIGLHLNSIGSAASVNINSNLQLLETISSIQDGKTLADDIDQVSEKSKDCPSSLISIDSENIISASEKPLHYAENDNNDEEKQSNQAFQEQSSVSYQTPLSVKPLNSSLPLKHIDRFMSPCTTKRLPSEETNRSEESTQTSPKKKRQVCTFI